MSFPLLRTVNKNERRALVEEWRIAGVPPYTAVVDLDRVRRTPTVLRTDHPCVFDPLPGVLMRSAVVQRCPTLGYRFLWCHVDNGSYRRHYLRFLQLEHGWRGTSIPSQWHVDHVFNRARAKKLQLEWVRMMLVPGPVNTSHGAGYEKQRTRSRITGTLGRERSLDDATLVKVSGVKSPRRHGAPPTGLDAHTRQISREHGLPAHEVTRNITDLLDI